MLKNTPLKSYVYFGFALNIITAAAILATHGKLPPIVPLFYGLPSGASELVPSFGLLLAPAASIAITTLNIFLCSHLPDEFLKKLLSIASFLVAILTTITVFKIIFLVGFW